MLLIEISENILDKLQTLYNSTTNKKNTYVTFTIHKKFGINPKSSFQTPLGIYAYPLKYVLDKKLDVPYAKNSPYVWVFQSDTIWDLQSSFKIKIKNNIINQLDERMIDVDDLLDGAKNNEDVYRGLKQSLKRLEGANNILFRSILVGAGVTGVKDGNGVIFGAEPVQAVFFFPTKLQVLTLLQQHTIKPDSNLISQTDHSKVPATFDEYVMYVKSGLPRDINVERTVSFDNIPKEDQLISFILACGKQKSRRIQFIEWVIAQYPNASLFYARDILSRRFRRGEKIMKKDPDIWKKYVVVFPEAQYN